MYYNITPTTTETVLTDEGEIVVETPTTGGGVVTGTGLASEASGQMISNAQSYSMSMI